MEGTNIVHLNSIEGYKDTGKYAYLMECGKNAISKPDNLTIVTSFTDREKALLIDQLDRNSINYINALEGIATEDFIKAFRPVYYYNVLKNVSTEYTLMLDAYDTAVKSLDNLEELTEYYGKDIIYNASLISFTRELEYEMGVPEEKMWRKLNAGVAYGKTDKILAFYHELSDYINKNYNDKPRIKNFEQWWLIGFLNIYKGKVKIGVDYDFKAFELIQHMDVEKTDKGYKAEPKMMYHKRKP